jgi:hypothetical protein
MVLLLVFMTPPWTAADYRTLRNFGVRLLEALGESMRSHPHQPLAGKRADLLLVEGDPTKNILDTRKIVAVWKREFPVQR